MIFYLNNLKIKYIYYFTKFLIQYYLYEKLFVKFEEKKFNSLIKFKKFQVNWFSFNCYYWLKYVDKMTGRVLEIGSFEGFSTLFILNKLNFNYLDCVDPWYGNEEMFDTKVAEKGLKPNLSEKNFDYNLREFQGKFNKIKLTSDEFFLKNKQNYNLIFIDGSHEYKAIYNDLKNSMNYINKGGIIIIDDIFFNYYKNLNENILFAVTKCLEEKKNFKILNLNYRQLILKNE
jgi:predicted O-methyltransferase YrrM